MSVIILCLYFNPLCLSKVLVCMRQYKDDLLASCLQLVLALPKEIVQLELKDLVPALQVSEDFVLSHKEEDCYAPRILT